MSEVDNGAKQEIVYVPMDELKPYGKNPRKNAPAVPSCMESIERFGFRGAIDVDSDMVIIRGHTRLMALKRLRDENRLPANVADGKVPVIIHRDLAPDLVRALRIADNKVAELSGWDDELLKVELLALPDIDFPALGFDLDELGLGGAAGSDGQTDADDVPDAPGDGEPVASVRGEVYQCGEHRLMCGDSTKAEDVQILMGEDRAEMVFTDPPWNVNYGADMEADGDGRPRTIMNDFMGTEEFKNFMFSAFKCMNSVSRPGAMTYVVMSAQEWGNMMLTLAQNEYHWSSTIIWNKDSLVLSRKDYHTKYEPIWYGWKEGEGRLCPLEDRGQSDVWDIDRPKRSELHPTTKPVELVERAINNSSRVGNVVLDLFGGSGTTMMAAEKTGRKARLMELDPHYCDVIRRRWAEFVHGEGCDWRALTPPVGKAENS